MTQSRLRVFGILAVIILAIVQIYPTIGWMTLSEEQRAERLAKWEEEDSKHSERSIFGDAAKSWRRWLEFDRSKVINLGLDLQGGVHMVVGFDIDELSERDRNAYEEAKYSDAQIKEEIQQTILQTVERRMAEFEAKEPLIQALGDSQVQIQLPGEKDVRRAQELITRTAFLAFHIVPEATDDIMTDALRAINAAYPERFTGFLLQPRPGDPFYRVNDEDADTIRNLIKEINDRDDLLPEGTHLALGELSGTMRRLYLLYDEPDLTGEGIVNAYAVPDRESLAGEWQVLFENTAESAVDFARVTGENTGRFMAIVVDGVVVSAPVIQTRIATSGSITGGFTPYEAQDLAIALNSGSLPVPIREDFTGVVGASLGSASVRSGVTSAVIGVLIVMAFMLVYYRVAGIIANIALGVNALLVLAALAYFNATLTLPGIAGLILTVGMAVDANVLIFERIREELRNGRSLAASVESGFQRASVTILDANVTTLIAAAVLFQFGTGPIESFAITLSIGVVTSVFSALIVSRAVFDFLVSGNYIKKLGMFSIVKPDTKVAFMGARRVALAFSAVALIAGMGIFGARGSDNFGVDFTTGTNMIVHFNNTADMNVEDVRGKLAEKGMSDVRVQRYSEGEASEHGNSFSIHLGDVTGTLSGEEGAQETVSTRAQLALAELVTDSPTAENADEYVVLDRVDTVGPAIGDQLKRDAVIAILYSIVCIVLYLWYRFEYKFAFAAIIAIIHDVLFTLGVFAVAQRELSLPVIAALLTIIGYSLNDTIVVFDRIREDMKLYRGREMKFSDILNISINQTLSRTLLTSMTTLFVVVVLAVFGGEAIRDFAIALTAGVVVGTYSSVFVASPCVLFLHNWDAKRRKNKLDEDTKSGKGGGRRRRKKKKKDDGDSMEKVVT